MVGCRTSVTRVPFTTTSSRSWNAVVPWRAALTSILPARLKKTWRQPIICTGHVIAGSPDATRDVLVEGRPNVRSGDA